RGVEALAAPGQRHMHGELADHGLTRTGGGRDQHPVPLLKGPAPVELELVEAEGIELGETAQLRPLLGLAAAGGGKPLGGRGHASILGDAADRPLIVSEARRSEAQSRLGQAAGVGPGTYARSARGTVSTRAGSTPAHSPSAQIETICSGRPGSVRQESSTALAFWTCTRGWAICRPLNTFGKIRSSVSLATRSTLVIW